MRSAQVKLVFLTLPHLFTLTNFIAHHKKTASSTPEYEVNWAVSSGAMQRSLLLSITHLLSAVSALLLHRQTVRGFTFNLFLKAPISGI